MLLCIAGFIECHQSEMSTVYEVKRIATKPFAGQKPGTSGLRKPVSTFQQENYSENFLQASLQAAFPELIGAASAASGAHAGDAQALVVSGDGRFLTQDIVLLFCSIAAANGVCSLI